MRLSQDFYKTEIELKEDWTKEFELKTLQRQTDRIAQYTSLNIFCRTVTTVQSVKILFQEL